jgi:ribosomal protein L39E
MPLVPTFAVSFHRTHNIKQLLAKKQKENCPIAPVNTGNKAKHDSRRRHRRGTQLGPGGYVHEMDCSHPASVKVTAVGPCKAENVINVCQAGHTLGETQDVFLCF